MTARLLTLAAVAWLAFAVASQERRKAAGA